MLSRSIRWFRRFTGKNPFTVTGRLLMLATLTSLFAIVEGALVGLLSYLIWLLMIAFLFGLVFRPKLQVSIERVPLVHSQRAFQRKVVLQNAGLFAAYDLEVRLASPSHGFYDLETVLPIPVIEPGRTVEISCESFADRRGVHQIPDIQVVSLFPLGLFRFISNYPIAQTICIAPELHSAAGIVTEVQEQFDWSEASGRNRSSNTLEYIGSREFQPGTPVRRWDFASWARLGKPAVREFAEGSQLAVHLLLDVTRRPGTDEDLQLESLLSCAASLIEHFHSEGIIVRLVPSRLPFDARRDSGRDEGLEFYMKVLAAEQGERQELDWSRLWGEFLASVQSEDTVLALIGADNLIASEVILTETPDDRRIVFKPIHANWHLENATKQSKTRSPA